MGERSAQTFESLRSDVLERLVEVRSTINHAYASVPDELFRDQFEPVLARLQAFLSGGDIESYRGFLHRWLAMRVGEGYAPETLVHSFVAVGDLVNQVARSRLGESAEVLGFCRDVVRLIALSGRLIVDNMAEELRRRLEQRSAGGGV